MKLHPFPFTAGRSRGSAFVTVLLFTFLLLTLVASILTWSLSERRLNVRASYWLEARNAAEALAEYGFSQIATQFSSQANPPTFDPGGSNPLLKPPTHTPMVAGDFFFGGNVDPTSIELIGGTAQSVPSSGALFLIDSTDPNNTNDTLKGQYVYRRDIQVLAKATVNPPSGGPPVTAYVMEYVSVRGAPLFANAIFYGHNDLEIFPGPQMDIYGPVHCNGNMFLSKQSTDSTTLNFHGPVSCSGDLYHAWSTVNTAGQGSGNENLKTDPVNFVPLSGNTATASLVNLYNSTAGKWYDSTMGTDSSLFTNGHYSNTGTDALTQLQGKLVSSFRQTASQTWGGNLQTAAMGVAAYNPIGSNGQVGVDGSGNAIIANKGSIDASGNVIDPAAADPLGYGPHNMIDPPNTALSTSDPYYDAKHTVEQQKYSNESGLYVQVVVTPGANGAADTAAVKLYSWPGSAAAAGVVDPARIGPNGGLLLGTVPSGLVGFVPYQATVTNSTTTTPATQTSYSVTGSGSSWHIKTTTTTGGTLTLSNATLQYNGTNSVGISGGSQSYSGGSSGSSTGTATYTSSSAAASHLPSPTTGYTTTGGSSITPNSDNATVTSGLYDQRQAAGVNLVQLDMAALRAALTDTNTNSNANGKAIVTSTNQVWGAGVSGGYSPTVAGSTGWNGAVYVQVTKSDGTPAGQTSVIVANGTVASGSNLVPAVNPTTANVSLGLTLATNAPLYVLGHFNANGTVTATSATTPDDGKTDAVSTPTSAEVPVALAADAITILSPGFFGTADTTDLVPSSNITTGTITGTKDSNGTSNTSASGSAARNSWYLRSTNATGGAADPNPGDTEIAAAFITGLVTTTASASSGGAHNLPRFLEDFSGNTVGIRGSLVCMYKSTIATGPWSTSYYSPPTRLWGFDVIFQNGHFPPLTPKVMSYRRVDFNDMPPHTATVSGVATEGYYDAKHRLWPTEF